MTGARIGVKRPPSFSLDVDFSLPPGITALFGPPGAGKTVILESLAGFVRPDSGRILIEDAIAFDSAAHVFAPPRRRACGYVSQRDALFPHMRLRRNLLFAAHASPRLERNRRVAEMLENFQLSAEARNRPRELSSGQKLRGAVARALLANPRLLLIDDRGADEPLLAAVGKVFSGPILLVTADLDLCCAAAGQLLLLEAGRIIQAGAPRAVVDGPGSVEAARLLGFANIFEGQIAALDPGRHSSRLEFESFALSAPFISRYFRGARVSVAVRAEDLRAYSGDLEKQPNAVPATLLRALRLRRAVRLEFAGPLFVDMSPEEYERQKDNRRWQVEFPPNALRVL